jgi:hypothetical protein
VKGITEALRRSTPFHALAVAGNAIEDASWIAWTARS